jgi:hypothetical protein
MAETHLVKVGLVVGIGNQTPIILGARHVLAQMKAIPQEEFVVVACDERKN